MPIKCTNIVLQRLEELPKCEKRKKGRKEETAGSGSEIWVPTTLAPLPKHQHQGSEMAQPLACNPTQSLL